MGFRFRRSFKIAPGLKVNLNKNSVGITASTRGAHCTVNSKGKRTTSIGIPGTGISYTSVSNSPFNESNGFQDKFGKQKTNKNNSDDNKQKWYKKTGWIVFMLIFFFPVGLFLMWKYAKWNKFVKVAISVFFAILILTPSSESVKEITLSADTSQKYDINEKILICCETDPSGYELNESDFIVSGGILKITGEEIVFWAPQPGKYNMYAEKEGVKSNEISLFVEDKEAIKQAEEKAKRKAEEEAKRKAEEEAKRKAEEDAKRQAEEEAKRQAQQAAQQSAMQQSGANTPSGQEDTIVYITNTGGKYHRSTCRHLKDSKIERKLSEVITNYGPCGTCHPPTQ